MNRARDHVEYLELVAYKCFHCEGLIGMCSRSMLYIGAARFTKTQTITCGYCGKLTIWRSGNESSPKNNGHSN